MSTHRRHSKTGKRQPVATRTLTDWATPRCRYCGTRVESILTGCTCWTIGVTVRTYAFSPASLYPKGQAV
ncbi:MAG TPA: hypothetical protein VJT31_23655 [Rugosimonospora sp.]|nr:hypothetical protein [Rugosimonospora sp.]